MNTYGYVSANPLKYVDPKGLAEWEGSYVEGSVDMYGIKIVDLGMRGFVFKLKPKCDIAHGVDTKYTVYVHALGGGANIDASSLVFVSLGIGSTTLDDNNGTQPNPNAFTGLFVVGNASFGLMPTPARLNYTPISYLKLGKATGNVNGWGISTDIGAIEGYVGYSEVVKIEEEPCGCEN